MSRRTRIREGEIGRRSFVKLLTVLTAGAVAVPGDAEAFDLDAFVQKHFHQISEEEKQRELMFRMKAIDYSK